MGHNPTSCFTARTLLVFSILLTQKDSQLLNVCLSIYIRARCSKRRPHLGNIAQNVKPKISLISSGSLKPQLTKEHSSTRSSHQMRSICLQDKLHRISWTIILMNSCFTTTIHAPGICNNIQSARHPGISANSPIHMIGNILATIHRDYLYGYRRLIRRHSKTPLGPCKLDSNILRASIYKQVRWFTATNQVSYLWK